MPGRGSTESEERGDPRHLRESTQNWGKEKCLKQAAADSRVSLRAGDRAVWRKVQDFQNQTTLVPVLLSF